MKKVNFKIPLKDNTGKELEISVSVALAQQLGMIQGSEQPLKVYGWHQMLLEEKELHFDDVDFVAFRKVVETDQHMFLFLKGQALQIMDAPVRPELPADRITSGHM